MTKRKPLEWYDTTAGPMPLCPQCADLFCSPMFVEAVFSVLIERPGSPADLARRAVDDYHANRHPGGGEIDGGIA